MNKKIILAGLLTLASVAGVVGTVGNAHKTEAADKRTVYLKPNANWTQSNAWFWVQTWGDGSTEKIKMHDNDGDGVYEVEIDDSNTMIIFVRANPSNNTVDWGSKWNQTSDLNIPTDGKNLYTVQANSWDYGNGSWSIYTPNCYLAGTHNSWDCESNSNKFVTHNSTEVKMEDVYLNANDEFKIVDKEWYGYSNVKSGCISLFDEESKDHNIIVKNSGVYDFYWDYVTNQLWAAFDTEKTAASIDRLFTKYYNEGSYVKETELNVSGIAEEECKKYFHAGALTKYRQTTYKPGELTMVTKSNEGDEWGTQTSTYKDRGNDTGVEHYSNGLKDYTVSGTVNGENRNSVDLWFVTLNDFITSGKTGWSYANGVYTFDLTETTTEMETMAREFIAPMWLKTTEAANYVTFDKITVEENSSTLIMKLYVESGNSGQLEEGSNLVFSEAKITKLVA